MEVHVHKSHSDFEGYPLAAILNYLESCALAIINSVSRKRTIKRNRLIPTVVTRSSFF